MTWIIVAVVVILVLFFLMSGKKQSAAPAALPPAGKLSPEDSRRKLEAEFARNKLRFQAMPDDEAKEIMAALHTDAETHWDHAYNTASADAKGAPFATQLALFRTAAVILTGEQQPDESFFGGLDLETVPFKELPPDQAKAAFFEYCVAKYSPQHADWNVLNPALLKFADKVFGDSKSQSNPDGYVYEMIYRETLDWQKFLAEALSNRAKANA
ncbi:hypothetical protein [Rhizobium leguminosarum]|uniref:hypothetical protein n=1 Tax=Rhizobium leguminosarum TaxID=384 RepID=UPI003F9C8F46